MPAPVVSLGRPPGLHLRPVISTRAARLACQAFLSHRIPRLPRTSLLCLAEASRSRQPITEVVRDVVADKQGLESLKLDGEVRKRTENAISRRGGRVTVGDVAADSGLSVFQAEAALRALATDTLATLQVSDDGEIVYVFDKRFKEMLRAKSAMLRLEPVVEGAARVAGYVGRIAFGTALVSSVVAVTMALVVISSAGRDDRNNRNSYGGGGGFHMMLNITDIIRLWDPWYYRRMGYHRPERMGFLEAVFSFVFGDGDPNVSFEKQRWEALGRYIQSRGGVATAEEMAPFLDVTPAQLERSRRSVVVDESYVLPALSRFGGSPEVDASGRIVYVFPTLQQTGRAAKTSGTALAVQEQRWKITEASAGQVAGVVALGIANLLGVAMLSSMLASPANVSALVVNGMGWMLRAMPFLQAYAASFFVIPAVRWLLNATKNTAIDTRNAARQAAYVSLQRPSPELQAKMQSAAALAQRKVISERDVVYRSDRGVDSQPIDIEAESFDRRLERRAAERGTRGREQENGGSFGGRLFRRPERQA